MDELSKLFRNIFVGSKKDSSYIQENTGPNNLIHWKYTNPFDECTVLNKHSDIIRVLTMLDDNRFASSSDDGVVIIWDAVTGESIHVMEGHTMPVTCFLVLENNILVSGSVDKSLRFWNIETGKCVGIIANSHNSSVQCLTTLGDGRFCSGGNDKFLNIWKNQGEKLGAIEKNEDENLHCLLAISHERVITGSNSEKILVYRTDTLRFSNMFTNHRESVRCFSIIDDEMFASGSLDGVVIVWQMESLTPLHKLSYPENYYSRTLSESSYLYAVHHLKALGNQYLAVCLGKGFQIYDVHTGHCVMECKEAHHSAVNSIITLWNGTRFVTCSDDSTIKIWGTEKDISFELFSDASKPLRRKKVYYPPVCLGEIYGHSDQVNLLLKSSETTFVSGAHDNMIIIWKDGENESHLRNVEARKALLSFNPHYLFTKESGWSDDEDAHFVEKHDSELSSSSETSLEIKVLDS